MNYNSLQPAATASSDRPLGPMEGEIQKSAEGLRELHDQLDALQTQLTLVSTGSEPKESGPTKLGEAPQCELHSQLLQNNQSLRNAIERVSVMRSRLRI